METAVLTEEQQAAQEKLDAFWNGVDEKVKAISSATNKKVIPIVIREIGNPENFVVGYMYRPDLITQLRLSDRGQDCATGFSQEEASNVLQALFIKSESDPRINMDTDEGEMYWKGALLVLFEFVKSAIPVLKKK